MLVPFEATFVLKHSLGISGNGWGESMRLPLITMLAWKNLENLSIAMLSNISVLWFNKFYAS